MREPIAVIGGGIGGLAAAIALHQAGLPVRVFERADELREIGASLGVQSNAVRTLNRLGCGEDILAAGEPIDICEGFGLSSGRLLMRWRQDKVGERLGAPSVMVRRTDLQQVLLNRLPPDVLTLSAEVSAVHGGDGDRPEIELATGERVPVPVVVGADGVRSKVRGFVHPAAAVRPAGYRVWRSITPFQHEDYPARTMRQYLGRGRTFSMWHLRDGSVSWSASLAGAPPLGRDGQLPLLRELFRDAPPVVHALLGDASEQEVIITDSVDLRPLPGWTRGRVTLLGDAAHATTQVTGQGAAQAIEDAVVLGRCLAGLTGEASTEEITTRLLSYQEARLARTTKVIKEARLLGTVFHWRSTAGCWLRDTAFRLRPADSWTRQMERRLSTVH
ncbi:FAD-dependent monooxygenase [Amycolatopsis sp. NPDC059657]|uniref:FAD-dependent monooxygenase n=1 Tax=Amycolatopsis sp. NPDC059657 TaxID=3346899 RepID=UPI0036735B80